MQLGLSSAAAPDARFAELLEVCARRGLAGLELREGDAHGLDEGTAPLAFAQATAAGVRITAWRVAAERDDARLFVLAATLRTRLLLETRENGVADAVERAQQLRGLGADVAVVVRGERSLAEAHPVLQAGEDVAWDAAPVDAHVGGQAEALLRLAGPRLAHITLLGGGPEVTMHEGRGVGELMGRIALAGYQGALAQAPSSTRYRVVWQAWLGRRGGQGCGSKASDPDAVKLITTTV